MIPHSRVCFPERDEISERAQADNTASSYTIVIIPKPQRETRVARSSPFQQNVKLSEFDPLEHRSSFPRPCQVKLRTFSLESICTKLIGALDVVATKCGGSGCAQLSTLHPQTVRHYELRWIFIARKFGYFLNLSVGENTQKFQTSAQIETNNFSNLPLPIVGSIARHTLVEICLCCHKKLKNIQLSSLNKLRHCTPGGEYEVSRNF